MTRIPTTVLVALLLVGSVATAATPVAGSQSASTNNATLQQDGCSFPFSATDATDTEVTVETEPESVVTLGPASAQTMWEIGARSKVVGTTQYASYLDGADSTANVSGSGRAFVSVERVVAQEPDLVLAANIVSDETVQSLRNAGITVYKFRAASSLEFVTEKTTLTGQLVGACDGANETVDWMETEIQVVQRAAEGQDSPKALYVFYGTTPGPDTYIDDLVTTAGAENLAATADLEYTATGYAQINPEVVADMRVEWLLLNDAQPEPRIPESPAYRNTVAVQQNQTILMQDELVNQPAPRSIEVMRNLSQTWFPDAYAEANASIRGDASTGAGTTADADSPTATDPLTDTTTGAATTGGTPGFTLVGAVAALLAVAAFARRP
ncbi:PGF-CTERM-anchored ABC transporter substrate-binding protein [Haloarchaeobius sp. HRN-SO-5]|uniref:PGF-CTERM-anchored ABC transporter substrate-binding protein n=1 Tax=Haloarchaeobius sp. HRN-SO-5 TaxID=3446118 RepID=UPI003EB7D65C